MPSNDAPHSSYNFNYLKRLSTSQLMYGGRRINKRILFYSILLYYILSFCRDQLLATGPTLFVECSPWDKRSAFFRESKAVFVLNNAGLLPIEILNANFFAFFFSQQDSNPSRTHQRLKRKLGTFYIMIQTSYILLHIQ